MTSLQVRLSARVGQLSMEVELDAGAGTLVLVGPNGAGKTSLLSLLLGALPAERGRIAVGDSVLYDSERGLCLPVEERRLAWVPQDYALFPHLTVRENVEFARASVRGRGASARKLLAELGIEAIADRPIQALSGGERQRVALARALAVSPRALLLDEPLAALDVHARREVRAFLRDWLSRLALPCIVVTHDPDDARSLGAHIAVLEAGRVTQIGSWEELTEEPASSFVEELVRAPR